LSKGATAFSAVDIHVTPGVTYYYVVTALSTAGESPWSNEVVVTAT
jgi:fibronectin type 3 domain-containing protein